jgi:hypothetical protein
VLDCKVVFATLVTMEVSTLSRPRPEIWYQHVERASTESLDMLFLVLRELRQCWKRVLIFLSAKNTAKMSRVLIGLNTHLLISTKSLNMLRISRHKLTEISRVLTVSKCQKFCLNLDQD